MNGLAGIINNTVCSNGTYLVNGHCVLCEGHCKDATPCNNLTGRCDNGCTGQWTGDFCTGLYMLLGLFLTVLKQWRDIKKTQQKYWKTLRFKRNISFPECSVRYFGQHCTSTCGNCNITSPACHQSDGHCLHGCENTRFKAPRCKGMLDIHLFVLSMFLL